MANVGLWGGTLVPARTMVLRPQASRSPPRMKSSPPATFIHAIRGKCNGHRRLSTILSDKVPRTSAGGNTITAGASVEALAPLAVVLAFIGRIFVRGHFLISPCHAIHVLQIIHTFHILKWNERTSR